MSFLAAIKSVLSQYATFSGRARRSEYWWFVLASLIVFSVLGAICVPIAFSSLDLEAGTVGSGYFAAMVPLWIVGLALLLPSLAVAVRRLHDTNRSGWWFLLAFIPLVNIWLIVLFATAGTAGPNRFGADPKAVATAAGEPVAA